MQGALNHLWILFFRPGRLLTSGCQKVDANQLNVLSEFIGGYMFQGKPVANMLFKILSTDVVGQGLYFVQDST